MPRAKSWFTALGGATLVVYLFHGFFVLGAEFAGFKGWAADHWPLSLGLVTVLAVPLALFLAWSPVSTRLNVLVDPVGASCVVGVHVRPPARADRVERHHVQELACVPGRGMAAEVGGVPGGHLAGTGTVVRLPLQALEQAGERMPEPVGGLDPGRPAVRRTTGSRRRGRPGGAAGQVDRGLGVADGEDPLAAPERDGDDGYAGRAGQVEQAGHQRAHREGVGDAGLGEAADRLADSSSRSRAEVGVHRHLAVRPARARIRSMNHGTTGTCQTSWRVRKRT